MNDPGLSINHIHLDRDCELELGPVCTPQNCVCFAKKIVNWRETILNANDVSMFSIHQNFCKCHQSSKMPSTTCSFGGLQLFVGQENLLLPDTYPSTANNIVVTQIIRMSQVQTLLRKKKSIVMKFSIFLQTPHQTFWCSVQTGPYPRAFFKG